MRSRQPPHYIQFLNDNCMSVSDSCSTSAPANAGQDLSPSAVPSPNQIPTPSQPNIVQDPQLCRLRVINLLRQPNHDRLDKLDPKRSPNTFWFDIDNKVGRSVSDTIKAYFTEPHANWSQTPQYIKDIWFETFAQKWHWDESITDKVRTAFETKATKRLSRIVVNWKKEWKKKGDIGKPLYISDAVWQGFVQYWSNPHSETKVIRCSTSRLYSNANGIGPPKRTSSQTSYARRRFAVAKDGQILPIVDVLVATHQKKDDTFVDSRSERIYNEVTAKVVERQSQLSPGSSSVQFGGQLSVTEMDQIYDEVAQRKKRHIDGVGSIRHAASSSSVDQPAPYDPTQLETRLDEAKAKIAELQTEVKRWYDFFDIIAITNPNVAQALQNLRAQSRSAPTEPSAFDRACTNAMNADLPDDHIPD